MKSTMPGARPGPTSWGKPRRASAAQAYNVGRQSRAEVNLQARKSMERVNYQVRANATKASTDAIMELMNFAVHLAIHPLVLVFAVLLVLGGIAGHYGTMVANTPARIAWVFKLLGISGIGQSGPGAADLFDLGPKVEKGDVFTRNDGGTVTVSSGWGPRPCVVPDPSQADGCASSLFHRGIDLPLEVGYPLMAYAQTKVVCSSKSGYGENGYATITILQTGQKFGVGHLNSCTQGIYEPGQQFAEIGNKGVSSGPHGHHTQYNDLGQLEAPNFNPIQGFLTGKWPGQMGTTQDTASAGGIDLDFIIAQEGFHPRAYPDGREGGRQRYSIGYGTKASGPTQTITKEQARKDMQAYLAQHCLPIIPDTLTTVGQKTAAASFCYNNGPGVKDWDIWKQMEAGNFNNVKFTSYVRNTAGANLLPRRQREQQLFNSGVAKK
jgi:GH24 family phage-related lysozyme (muramidase)